MTNASLLTKTRGNGLLAVRRLSDVLRAIVQASGAAGLAWYMANVVKACADDLQRVVDLGQ